MRLTFAHVGSQMCTPMRVKTKFGELLSTKAMVSCVNSDTVEFQMWIPQDCHDPFTTPGAPCTATSCSPPNEKASMFRATGAEYNNVFSGSCATLTLYESENEPG